MLQTWWRIWRQGTSWSTTACKRKGNIHPRQCAMGYLLPLPTIYKYMKMRMRQITKTVNIRNLEKNYNLRLSQPWKSRPHSSHPANERKTSPTPWHTSWQKTVFRSMLWSDLARSPVTWYRQSLYFRENVWPNCMILGIVRGIVFLKIGYICREFTPIMYFLLTIYFWCWSCTPEWHFCRSLLSKRLWNLFLCYRRHEQFVVPVTGCSVWDDFVLGHAQLVDDRRLIHS